MFRTVCRYKYSGGFKPPLFIMELIQLSKHGAVAHIVPVNNHVAANGVKGA